MANSTGGLAQRSPGEGPEPGPSRAGRGAGQAGRSLRGLRGGSEPRPAPALPRPPPPQPPPPPRPAQAPPTTQITCAPRTLPRRGPGARGRESGQAAGSRGRKLRGRTRGLGTRPKTRHRAGTRPGPAGGSGRAGGGACREGRGLLLGLAQETRRRGRSYWLPVWAACLLLAGEL